MMSSSQKGPQRAKQITQKEIMTTLIKQWHHHSAFNTHRQTKPINISVYALRRTDRTWTTQEVPLDYPLPSAFSQPWGLYYHQTTGLMGESRPWGKASETLLLEER